MRARKRFAEIMQYVVGLPDGSELPALACPVRLVTINTLASIAHLLARLSMTVSGCGTVECKRR